MIAKLLLTVAAIALVWLVVRHAGRRLGRGAAPGTGRVGDGTPSRLVGDLTRCAVCEAYVEAGAAACDRAGCPMAGPGSPAAAP